MSDTMTLAEVVAARDESASKITRLRAELDSLSARSAEPGVAQRMENIQTALDKVAVTYSLADAAYRKVMLAEISSGERFETIAGDQRDTGPKPVQHLRKVNPWAEGADLRDRAMAAIDEHHRSVDSLDADKLARMVDAPEDAVSGETRRYILATGSKAYRSAFSEWLRNPTRPMWTNEETAAMRQADSLRAAMSLTTAFGGALVPYVLDPTINLTNSGTASPLRRLANVVTIAGSNEWRGVTSAGVNAEWLAEGAEAADASPNDFAQPAISTIKGMAYLFGSYEVLADSGFETQLSTVLTDAKDRIEATAFATGNGTTQPQGIITGLVAGSSIITSTTTDTLAVGDVYRLQEALPPRFRRGRSSWLANIAIQNRIRQFDTAGGSSLWAQLGAGTPGTLLGDPIYECSDMDGVINATQDNYCLVNGDIAACYTIVDRLGLEVVYDSMVLGANRRPTGQAGFVGYFRTGARVIVPQAARVLNVT